MFLLHDTKSSKWKASCFRIWWISICWISGALQPLTIKRGQLQCYRLQGGGFLPSLLNLCFRLGWIHTKNSFHVWKSCGTLFCHDKTNLIFVLALKIHECTRDIRKLENFCVLAVFDFFGVLNANPWARIQPWYKRGRKKANHYILLFIIFSIFSCQSNWLSYQA